MVYTLSTQTFILDKWGTSLVAGLIAFVLICIVIFGASRSSNWVNTISNRDYLTWGGGTFVIVFLTVFTISTITESAENKRESFREVLIDQSETYKSEVPVFLLVDEENKVIYFIHESVANGRGYKKLPYVSLESYVRDRVSSYTYRLKDKIIPQVSPENVYYLSSKESEELANNDQYTIYLTDEDESQ